MSVKLWPLMYFIPLKQTTIIIPAEHILLINSTNVHVKCKSDGQQGCTYI